MLSPIGLRHRWLLLICGDFVVSSAAAYLAFALVGTDLLSASAHCDEAMMVLGLQYLATMYFQDLYRFDEPRSPAWISASVLSAAVKSVVLVGLVVLAIPVFAFGRRFYIFYFAASAPMLMLWRVIANYQFATRFRVGVMALGFAEYGPILADEVNRHGHVGYRFLGFAQLEGGGRESAPMRHGPGIETTALESISQLKNGHKPSVLVLLEEVTSNGAVRELIRCRARGIKVLDVESFYERMLGKLPIAFLRESWLLHAPGFARSGRHWSIKRIVDIAAAIAIGLATLPLSILTALAIKLDSPGPVFYQQDRVGLDGKVFKVYKFRSMRHRSEAERGLIWATEGDSRITRVGRIIRRHRIDELPQLLNVLQGSMSIVGPRPQHPEWVERLGRAVPFYEWRQFVRPGLTGWAQVCCSYGASVEDHREMLAYDLYYMKNWTLTLDLQIMLQTAKVAIFGRGAR